MQKTLKNLGIGIYIGIIQSILNIIIPKAKLLHGFLLANGLFPASAIAPKGWAVDATLRGRGGAIAPSLAKNTLAKACAREGTCYWTTRTGRRGHMLLDNTPRHEGHMLLFA